MGDNVTITKPGIFPGLSNDFYHKSDGISKSGLDLITEKNPAMYYRRYYEQTENKTTAAMILGSATHTLVFEPNQFDKEFAVEPEINRRTTAGKKEAAQFALDNAKKGILTQKDYEQAIAISTSVINHPIVGQILAKGTAETSYYAKDDVTDLLVKVRPDWESGDTLYDLKTCIDASPVDFAKTIYNRRYFIQAAMYAHIVNLAYNEERIQNFVFIAVEKSEPYQVAIYRADDAMMFAGIMEYRRAMDLYNFCMINDEWPGYNDDKIASISLPGWAENKLLKVA